MRAGVTAAARRTRLAGSAVSCVLLAACSLSSASSTSSPVHHVVRPVIHEVVGLGDSVPAGGACSCTSFVTLLAQRLSDRRDVPAATVRNQAVGGLTSQGLLGMVTATRLQSGPGTVILVTIGANDFDSSQLSRPACVGPDGLACFHSGLVALAQHLEATLRLLLPPGRAHGLVLLTGYWNVFLDGSVGRARGPDYVSGSLALTSAVSGVIRSSAENAGQTYVDLDGAFHGPGVAEDDLLATDGDHLSAAGHEVVATLLDGVVRRLLRAERKSGTGEG